MGRLRGRGGGEGPGGRTEGTFEFRRKISRRVRRRSSFTLRRVFPVPRPKTFINSEERINWEIQEEKNRGKATPSSRPCLGPRRINFVGWSRPLRNVADAQTRKSIVGVARAESTEIARARECTRGIKFEGDVVEEWIKCLVTKRGGWRPRVGVEEGEGWGGRRVKSYRRLCKFVTRKTWKHGIIGLRLPYGTRACLRTQQFSSCRCTRLVYSVHANRNVVH